MTDLSEQLRDAIAKSGLSLKQLGKAARVDEGRLSRFLRGERDLTLRATSQLCRVLGLELCEDEAPRPPDTTGLPGLPPSRSGRKRDTLGEGKAADQGGKNKPAGKSRGKKTE